MKELNSTVIVKIDLLGSSCSFILLNLKNRLDRRMRINLNINKSSMNSTKKHLIYEDYSMIILGCDVHKNSHAIVAVDLFGKMVGKKIIKNNYLDFQELLIWVESFDKERIWGIENSQHYGKHLAEFLIEQNQEVYDITPKLTAQIRSRSLKSDKSDTKDAIAIAKAVIQEKDNLHKVNSRKTDTEILKKLTRFRDSLVKKKTDFINQLHKALYDYDPQYREKVGNITTLKGINKVKYVYTLYSNNENFDVVYKKEILTLVSLVESITNEIKMIEQEQIKPLSQKIKSTLLSIDGVGEIILSVLLGEIGDIKQYKNSAKLASRAGISPIENSSAKNNYKRVNPGGNRRLNTAIHRIALYQIRKNELASKYYQKKKTEGKTSREALRCLKRRLVDIIYSVMKNNKPYEIPKTQIKSDIMAA